MSVAEIRTVTAVALAACLAAACSTAYVPRPGRRLSVVMTGGQLAYQRDGRVIPHGFLGGGLIESVSGVPAAEGAARTYRRRVAAGGLMLVGGLVCSFVALGVAFERSADEESGPPLAVSGGCLLAGLTGGIVLGSAAPYQWDAINLYNDAVETAVPLPAPAGGPPGATTPAPVR